MRKLILVIFLLISGYELFAQNKDSVDETDMKPYQLIDISENVSLVKLIANPEKYDGKRIQVIGYLHLEFEGNAIYLHADDYKKHIYENSFWVEFSPKLTKKINPKNFNDKYVIIIGRFSAKQKGHMGMFGGTFNDIVRLDLWED